MRKTDSKQFLNEDCFLQFFISPRYRLFRHLILIIFICLVLYNSGPELAEPSLILLLFLALFYLNMYLLVPKLLFKGRYILYTLTIAGIIAISVKSYLVGRYLLNSYPGEDEINVPLFSALVVVLVAASASIKFFQKWMADRQLIYELEKSKISTELNQLKNQINPHFLFNILNNANVLTKKDPDKASQLLVKLSDLLRYQLYDSAREQVFLTADIHFLEDFLNLEKVRRDHFDFVISKEGDISGVQVPPLLFISFVENAVKHNNDADNASYVNLFFNVRDNELNFKCSNSKPLVQAVNKPGGLGLANVKRRLELLFLASHTLHIEDNAESYSVTLTIRL